MRAPRAGGARGGVRGRFARGPSRAVSITTNLPKLAQLPLRHSEIDVVGVVVVRGREVVWVEVVVIVSVFVLQREQQIVSAGLS